MAVEAALVISDKIRASPSGKGSIRKAQNGRINLLLDIQSRLQGRGPGYER